MADRKPTRRREAIVRNWDLIVAGVEHEYVLGRAASAIEARQRRNRETGSGPEGESAVAKPDAQGTHP